MRPTPPPRALFAALGALAVALALAAAVLVGGARRHRGPDATPSDGRVRVAEVIDGDTIVVRWGRHSETVRLIGIDTPETKHPTKPVQCGGHEASARTAALLPPGTVVGLERDVEERDVYGRLLAYVHRDDGLFVNLQLALEGHAAVLSIAPNTAHRAEIAAAVDAARAAGRGLWGACGGPGVPVGSRAPVPSGP